MDRNALLNDTKKNVKAYKDFLNKKGVGKIEKWEDVPICDKQNYLLKYSIEELYKDNSMKKCFLIGSSSGFSKNGNIFWLKQSDNEKQYLEAVKQKLIEHYAIDEYQTLVIVSLALGTWIGGMQLACTFRSLSAEFEGLTTATPGMDMEESINIAKQFGHLFERILWVTNPSSINIIYSLLAGNKDLLSGKIFFPAVGEYFTENYRESIADKFGHKKSEPFALWTGYGSADAGDLGMENKSTIMLRKYLNKNKHISKAVFKEDNPPMMFEVNTKAFIESIDNNIVVTKEQFIPLIRYNTQDIGGVIKKSVFKKYGIDNDLLNNLPDEILYVHGRADNAAIFYGTNINIDKIGDFLTSLNDQYLYGGLFEVEKRNEKDIDFFEFTVYVLENRTELNELYTGALIEFLKQSSKEFNAKYDRLSHAVGNDLVEVKIKCIKDKKIDIKHHTIKR